MDWQDADGSDSSPNTSTTKTKKPYTAPSLVEWGTLRDLTQSVGSTASSDGATKGTRRKTH
jgi:hypothetical protein